MVGPAETTQGSPPPPSTSALQGGCGRRRRALGPPPVSLAAQSGMLPCFRGGLASRLLRSISKALITRARVSRGSITSST